MPPDTGSSDWQLRLLTLVEQAMELPAAERAEFLTEQSDGDDRLREEAALLLSMEDEATEFLPESITRTQWHPLTARGSKTAGEAAPDESLLGAQFGKYLLVEKLGRGGMGIVWRAEDMVLRRDVAVKVLPRGMSENETASHRFLREARAAAKISHANAVTIYDFGREQDRLYLTMELVRGPSLDQLISRSGRLRWRVATELVIQVLNGLEVAHEAGLVHRDIKPGNILLATPDGSPKLPEAADRVLAKLADFGISKSIHDSSLSLTGDSATLGTPSYMSPEQVRGEQLDARSDLYSLGATYYAMLTGHPPFVRDDALQIMFAHCDSPIPNPCHECETLPRECREIISKSLAKTAGERFQSVAEMRQSLQQLLHNSTLESIDATISMPNISATKKSAVAQPAPAAKRSSSFPIVTTGIVLAVLLVMAVVAFSWPGGEGQSGNSPGGQANQKPFSSESLTFFAKGEEGHELQLTDKLGSLDMTEHETALAWAVSEGEMQQGRIVLHPLDRAEPLLDHLIETEYSMPTCIAFLGEQSLCIAVRSRVLLLAPDRTEKTKTQVTNLLQSDDGTCYSLAVDSRHRRLAVNTHLWSDKTSRLEILELLADRESIKAENRREVPLPTASEISTVCFSPNGAYLAAADDVGNVYIVDPKLAEVVQTLKVSADNPIAQELGHGLEFSSDNQWLAAGGGNAVHVWRMGTWEKIAFPKVHRDTIMSVAFTDDAQRLASGSADGIYLWDLNRRQQIGSRLEGHNATYVTFLRFTPDGNSLFSAGFDDRVRWRKID